jgi:hypothetical protein
VLAAKDVGNNYCQTANALIGCVDDPPATLDGFGFSHGRVHGKLSQ